VVNTTLNKRQITYGTICREQGLDGVEAFSKCKMYNNAVAEVGGEENNRTTTPCSQGWIYSTTDFESTIPTENNWVCAKDFHPTAIYSGVSIGSFVGSIIFGPMADK